jgi:hypothetical protein
MFQLSKSAVLELGRPPQRLGAPRDAVSVVAEIVALDRKLATSAIAEAAAQDGVPQLDTARSQLAAGDAARAADTPDALDHYKNAWNAAEQAVRG